MVRTTSSPTPRPEILVTLEAVENPGRKMSASIAVWLMFSALLFGDQTGLDGASDDALVVEPTAIVTDLDDNVATFVVGSQSQLAGARFAVRFTNVGSLDSMIDRVANEVEERPFDRFDDGFVEIGFLALHFELDLLAEAQSEIAGEAWQFPPDRADGLHPGPHDGFLKFARDAVEAL